MSTKYVVSLKDIAKEADVSITTVSRALQGKGEIGQKTRDRIIKTAEELGYHSNLLISGMRTGKTKTIGVMMPISDPFFNQIIQGVYNVIKEAEYVPIVVWPDADGVEEQDLLHRLMEHRVEGIIIRPTEDSANRTYFQEVYDRGVPVVTVDRELPYVDFPFAGSDDVLGGTVATQHLISLGHKHIGHIQGPQFTSPGRGRRKGFEMEMAKHSDVVPYISEENKFHYDVESVIAFLKENPQITAVFAANDTVAVGVCHAAASLGLKVPEDLSVVGYGNLPYAPWLQPSLTTVEQFPRQIGTQAAELLMKRLDGKTSRKSEQRVFTTPELCPGNSSQEAKK